MTSEKVSDTLPLGDFTVWAAAIIGSSANNMIYFFIMLIVVIVCFMLSARLSDERAQLVGELGVGHEILYVEVHAVTPVVLRIGRDIDALGIGIGQTQALAHGKPVLKTQNAEHRRRVEMTGNDILGEPFWQRMGRRAFAVEHGVGQRGHDDGRGRSRNGLRG